MMTRSIVPSLLLGPSFVRGASVPRAGAARAAATRPRERREEGQTTAEYALVILAAAAVAVVLIAWAHSSGRLPAFFDQIIERVIGSSDAA